jgi:hypothetical protein
MGKTHSRWRLVFCCAGCAVLGAALGLGAARLFPPSPETGGGRAHRAGRAAGAAVPETAQNGRAGGGAQKSGPLENIAAGELRARIGAWLAAGAPGGDARDAALECLAEWARRDARAALKFVHAAAVFPGRNEALAVPLAAIGRADMAAAIAWLRANLPEHERGEVAQDVIAFLADEAPLAAVALVLADGVPVESPYIGRVLRALVRVSPAEAVAVFGQLPEEGRAEVASDFAGAWLQTDPAAALAWCAQNRDAVFTERLRGELCRDLLDASSPHAEALLDRLQMSTPEQMGRWVWDKYCQRFPEKALARLQAAPDGVSADSARFLAAALFSSGNPDEAFGVMKIFTPAGEIGGQLYDSWSEWARSDHKAAEAWLEKLPDGKLRAQVRDQDTATTNPVEFLKTAGAGADAEAARRAIWNSDFGDQNHCEAVLDWLGRNPGGITPAVVERLAFGNAPPAALLATVEQMPAGAPRDAALAAAASGWLGNGDTALAAELLPSIAAAGARDALRFQIYREMQRRDPAAAAGWLAAQPLPPEVRASWEAIAKDRE